MPLIALMPFGPLVGFVFIAPCGDSKFECVIYPVAGANTNCGG